MLEYVCWIYFKCFHLLVKILHYIVLKKNKKQRSFTIIKIICRRNIWNNNKQKHYCYLIYSLMKTNCIAIKCGTAPLWNAKKWTRKWLKRKWTGVRSLRKQTLSFWNCLQDIHWLWKGYKCRQFALLETRRRKIKVCTTVNVL